LKSGSLNELKKITIIVPVFNEAQYIREVVEDLMSCDFGIEKEIIIIDNKSTDSTWEIINNIQGIKVFSYSEMQGRSAAINFGITKATGDFITFQDGDKEIPPQNLVRLFAIMMERQCQVVFGSRYAKRGQPKNLSYYANKFFTFLSNLLYGLQLTDLQTSAIIVDAELLKSLRMKSQVWDFSIEFASKISRLKNRINLFEAPVDYFPRSKEEGKKITYSEGFRAIYHIFYYKLKNNNDRFKIKG
jgi:glycosyltransferase involved in cell wall biosynthesis